jgi:hypothetical protein
MQGYKIIGYGSLASVVGTVGIRGGELSFVRNLGVRHRAALAWYRYVIY